MVLNFTVFKTQIRESLLREQLMAMLSGFFGALAIILAMVGLYGVISYMVVQRRNEIGVRMALGASRRDILTMILREAAILLGIGLAVGTLLALVAGNAASLAALWIEAQRSLHLHRRDSRNDRGRIRRQLVAGAPRCDSASHGGPSRRIALP